jgi:hypothetical protein
MVENADMLVLGGVEHQTFAVKPLQRQFGELRTVVVVFPILVLQVSPISLSTMFSQLPELL